MKCLLDTHTLLWFGTNDSMLPASIRALIEDPGSDVGISIASFWEIGIKVSVGKLHLKSNVLAMEQEAANLNIEILPISVLAIHEMTRLPQLHKDPFDRIIAATSLVSGDVLLSVDTIFDDYGVSRLWG